MKTKQKILFSLLLLIFAILVQGCTTTNEPGENTGDPAIVTPSVQDLVIVADGASDYALIVCEGASDAVSSVSRSIRSALQEVTGVQLAWTDDYIERGGAAAPHEILIGMTNRAESLNVLQDVNYGEYAIRVVGEKIVIAAWDDVSLAKACEEFVALIQKNGTDGQFAVGQDYAAQAVGLEALQTLPRYGEEDEEVFFVDLADECYMLYADDTDSAEFEAYFAVLENAGYTRFASRQYGENLYAIYTSEDKIIHASYMAADKDVRISIEDSYDMSIFVESEYEKICEPSVTMVGLECYGKDEETGVYNQIGLSLIFRLEDGRFIVVDGGGYYKKSASLLYDNLRDLAVDKDNITVAAWILTHAHGDHTGGFLRFTEADHHTKITVENIIHHFTTPAQYEGIPEGPDEGRAQQTRDTLASEYPNANIIKAHAGQRITVGGMEIEMLYTFADLEPTALEYHNTTSLVFRVTVDENTVMVLGDASNRTSQYLVRAYGDYLKSDIVQISHHGYTGGTVELYEAIDADVALWPGGVARFDGENGLEALKERTYNKKALELAEEVYVAGDSVYTLILPYIPEDGAETKIIK